MTESVIQPKPFPKYSCIFDIFSVLTDQYTLSMSPSSIIISAFELR